MSLLHPIQWTEMNANYGTQHWAVDNTTMLLSEHYFISVEELDTIYDLQTAGPTRQELNETMLATPVYGHINAA